MASSETRIPLFDAVSLEQHRKQLRLDPQQIRMLRKCLCKQYQADLKVREQYPWSNPIEFHTLAVHERFDSQRDGATKLVMKTMTGMLIETVILRIATGRTTVCVSSQVGCAAACDFCATGRMGVSVNLSAAEIVDQILLAGQYLALEGRSIRNIVFMGMGEPFHNESNLHAALRLLTSKEYFHHSAKRIIVSSVGVADAMLRCAREFPAIGLALSLHSVRREIREPLIPLTHKYPLDQLQDVIRTVNELQSCPVMIEYLMLAGKTDTQEDVLQLGRWLRGLNVHVNLIPFNAIEGSQLEGSDRSVIHEFASQLKAAGFKTTTRYSLGSDIGAACGQLVQQENRRVAKTLAIERA